MSASCENLAVPGKKAKQAIEQYEKAQQNNQQSSKAGASPSPPSSRCFLQQIPGITDPSIAPSHLFFLFI